MKQNFGGSFFSEVFVMCEKKHKEKDQLLNTK
jgi:hypothetical protein